jgi:hypothetical protein
VEGKEMNWSKMPGGTESLISSQFRAALTVASIALTTGSFIALFVFQILSIKIIALYMFTACMMILIIIRKNHVNIYEISIFCFLCAGLLSLAPKPGEMDGLVATSYLLSYRYGVSSRSFIATVVDLLCNGGFVSKDFVWHFIFCGTVFLVFLLSCFIGLVIQRSKPETKPFVLFLTLFYLTCFTSPCAYFVPGNFGRLEIFAFIFMLVMLAVLERPVLRWIIPVLALFTMATHIILVFFYVPFIAIMLLYVLLVKANRNKCEILHFAVTITVIITAFLLYFFFHENTFVFKNAQSLAVYLQTKSNLDFSEEFLYMTLFAKLQDHLGGWKSRVILGYSGNLSVLINIPFVAAFVIFWIKCFLRETRKTLKFFFILPILLLLCQMVAFFMFFDFGRWMIMVMNTQLILLFYLLYTQNETVISLAGKTAPCIVKYRFVWTLIFISMAFLGPVNQISPSVRIMRIVQGISMVFGISP